MKDMKMKQGQAAPTEIQHSYSEYPYGLRICLTHEVLEKLGITDLPEVGSKMKLQAEVEVISTSEYETKDSGKKKSMDLQICMMDLKNGKKEVSPKDIYDNEKVPEVRKKNYQGF